jgi:hypothetical protein
MKREGQFDYIMCGIGRNGEQNNRARKDASPSWFMRNAPQAAHPQLLSRRKSFGNIEERFM